jgi:hypothetical protein
MHECTIPDGEEPTTLIKGNKDKKYIIGIDPSFSNSPSSDYFAIAVMELDDKNKVGTLVHNYAVAGGDLKDHINYMYYLMNSFNVVMICIDNAGYQFLDSCNENKKFLDNKIKMNFFDFKGEADGEDYIKEVRDAKTKYNKEKGTIAFKMVFSSESIRKANEHLQACVDYKKIWFASRASANGEAFDRQVNQKIPIQSTGEINIGGLIETQDNLVYQTKKQCALVEVKSTARGNQTFDLPMHLKRSTSATRARKDNYTALMLANWGIRSYHDISSYEQDKIDYTFMPRMV